MHSLIPYPTSRSEQYGISIPASLFIETSALHIPLHSRRKKANARNPVVCHVYNAYKADQGSC
jgi:hypothetical protein